MYDANVQQLCYDCNDWQEEMNHILRCDRSLRHNWISSIRPHPQMDRFRVTKYRT